MVVVIVGRWRGARVTPAAEALVSVGRVGLVEVVEHLLAQSRGREALPLRRRRLQFALQSES